MACRTAFPQWSRPCVHGSPLYSPRHKMAWVVQRKPPMTIVPRNFLRSCRNTALVRWKQIQARKPIFRFPVDPCVFLGQCLPNPVFLMRLVLVGLFLPLLLLLLSLLLLLLLLMWTMVLSVEVVVVLRWQRLFHKKTCLPYQMMALTILKKRKKIRRMPCSWNCIKWTPYKNFAATHTKLQYKDQPCHWNQWYP